ncbi:unnamed protein product [Linum trigynum]|uniref:Uncharacterized protein n=1 Tax=Linum trigynum TaxID=586398 RepID=A0AAV2FEQ2_9ROSI
MRRRKEELGRNWFPPLADHRSTSWGGPALQLAKLGRAVWVLGFGGQVEVGWSVEEVKISPCRVLFYKMRLVEPYFAHKDLLSGPRNESN